MDVFTRKDLHSQDCKPVGKELWDAGREPHPPSPPPSGDPRRGRVKPNLGKQIRVQSTGGPFTKSPQAMNRVLARKNSSLACSRAHCCLLTCWRADLSQLSGTRTPPVLAFLFAFRFLTANVNASQVSREILQYGDFVTDEWTCIVIHSFLSAITV